MHQSAYISLFICTLYSIVLFEITNQHTDMQIVQYFERQWGMSLNAYEEMLARNSEAGASYSDSDPDAT